MPGFASHPDHAGRWAFRFAALFLAFCTTSAQGDALDGYHRAVAVLEASRRALGPLPESWAVRLEGTRDLTARWQGRDPNQPEPTAVSERISVDGPGGRTAYEVEGYNYFSSRQHLREVYDDARRALYIDLRNENGGWMPFAADPGMRLRYQRVLPQVVIDEALVQRASVRWAGQEGGLSLIRYVTSDGESLQIAVDDDSHLPRSVSTLIDMELVGDSLFEWRWNDYERSADGGMVPARLQTRLNGETYKSSQLQFLPGPPDGADFGAPEGIEIAPAPESVAPRRAPPPSARPAEVASVAPGVWFLRNLRPGFHVMFVAFERFVVAVDAPTGWFEMQQYPPRNFVTGETGRSLTEKYLTAIRATLPDRPLKFVVLTHHHSDHVGGARAFARAGATLLGSETTTAAVAAALRRADTLTALGEPPPIETESYNGRWVISDPGMTLELIELPPDNPKARGMTLVYLPRQKLAYLAGFIYPVPEAAFPIRESVPLSRWFVQWLDGSGLEIETLLNVHASGRVENWQLDALRRMVE